MALVLSSVLIMLVSTTFLVQNQYYASQILRAGAHDNARVATERVASEVRATMPAGILVAGPRTLTVRSPIVVAMVCDRQGADAHVHFEGGLGGLDADEVAGVAVRDSTTGAWSYESATWATLDGGALQAATRCVAAGADTVGASAEFRTLGQLDVLFGAAPARGVAVMLYRETTFKIQESELDPGRLGLFRGIYGGPLVEFATGMDASAQFQYRTGGSTFADTLTSTSLADVDAVRIVADARKPARTGGQDDVRFGWAVTVALREGP